MLPDCLCKAKGNPLTPLGSLWIYTPASDPRSQPGKRIALPLTTPLFSRCLCPVSFIFNKPLFPFQAQKNSLGHLSDTKGPFGSDPYLHRGAVINGHRG